MTDPHHLVGTQIAQRYSVDALVEETGFSLVYRATHVVWRRPVAIKVFKGVSGPTEAARAGLLASFVREGALLGELSEMCSAVCQARDVGALTTSDGIWMPYMVLEWLEGDSLEAVLLGERERGSRPRTLEEGVRTLSPIVEALACAHARGIVHCDVKPANIMVLPSAHGTAQRAFTPAYAAPEQFDSAYGPTGPCSDIYALALIVVEMVCGRVALKGDGVAALCLRSCDPERRPSPRALGVDVGERAELVVDRALALRPEDRFSNVRSFWAELSGTRRVSAASSPMAAPSAVP